MAGRPERRLSFAVAAAGEQRLALSVSDTGCGFSPRALEHLFVPFFTTKQPGEGLGLGLTISRDILRDFGGDLLAEPAPGGGARFIVLLPLSTVTDNAMGSPRKRRFPLSSSRTTPTSASAASRPCNWPASRSLPSPPPRRRSAA